MLGFTVFFRTVGILSGCSHVKSPSVGAQLYPVCGNFDLSWHITEAYKHTHTQNLW